MIGELLVVGPEAVGLNDKLAGGRDPVVSEEEMALEFLEPAVVGAGDLGSGKADGGRLLKDELGAAPFKFLLDVADFGVGRFVGRVLTGDEDEAGSQSRRE